MSRTLYICVMCLWGFTVVTSCNNETGSEPDVPKEVEQIKLTFRAVQGNGSADTRTQINSDKTVSWNKGDKITVFSKDKGYEFTTDSQDLEVDFDGIVNREDDVYYALFPNDYDAYHDPSDPTTIITSIPADRQAVPNSFAKSANITVAKTTKAAMRLEFKNVCGLIKFNLSSDHPEDITKIVLQGNNDESISGQLQITNVGKAEDPDDETYPLTGTVTGSGKTITLTPPHTEYIQAGDHVYYIVVPPTVFRYGITLTYYYQNANTNQLEMSAVGIKKTAECIVARSSILDVGTITYNRPAFSDSEGFTPFTPPTP